MTSQEVVLYGDGETALVDEQTGEIVALADASREQIAAGLRDVEIRIRGLVEIKRELGEALIGLMDHNASWTTRARGVEVTAPSPKASKVEWDAEALAMILVDLVKEGVITLDASLAACEPRTEYKVLIRGLNAILKLPGVEARIAIARREVEPPARRVKVDVKRGGE